MQEELGFFFLVCFFWDQMKHNPQIDALKTIKLIKF